jgi:hypothetical protein
MGGMSIALADWWACDEEAARARIIEAAREHGGRGRDTCDELGVKYLSAMCGYSRRAPWAVFLREECRRARELRAVHRRPVLETRVSNRGTMMGWEP